MFERFTKSARAIVKEAHQEAGTLGHDRVSTGHLLLALHKDAEGVGGRVLREFEVEYDALRKRVARLGSTSELPRKRRRGLLGRLRPEYSTFSAHAKRALEGSLRAALGLKQNFIGTGHLLIGVLTVDEGSGRHALEELGVDLGALRAAVEKAAGEEAP